MFCGFAPMSETADEVSKRLGNRTVLSGSVSHGNNASQSLQMIERLLMTGDELRTMEKGSMLVTKTGAHPLITKMKLYKAWGITFGEPYTIQDKSARPVQYVSEKDIAMAIMKKSRLSLEHPSNQSTKSVPKPSEISLVVAEPDTQNSSLQKHTNENLT